MVTLGGAGWRVQVLVSLIPRRRDLGSREVEVSPILVIEGNLLLLFIPVCRASDESAGSTLDPPAPGIADN